MPDDEKVMDRVIEAGAAELLKDEPEYDWQQLFEEEKQTSIRALALADKAQVRARQLNADIEAFQEQIKDLKRQVAGWKALAEGRNYLLIAYRTGGQPPQKAFTLLDRGRKLLGL